MAVIVRVRQEVERFAQCMNPRCLYSETVEFTAGKPYFVFKRHNHNQKFIWRNRKLYHLCYDGTEHECRIFMEKEI